jgi:hypothetical protein
MDGGAVNRDRTLAGIAAVQAMDVSGLLIGPLPQRLVAWVVKSDWGGIGQYFPVGLPVQLECPALHGGQRVRHIRNSIRVRRASQRIHQKQIVLDRCHLSRCLTCPHLCAHSAIIPKILNVK